MTTPPAHAPFHMPASVPRRQGRVAQLCGRLVLKTLGWRVEGSFPDSAKMVLVGAPHTSNWDAIVGLAAAYAVRLDVHILIKHTAFRWPLGPVLRVLGGIPVQRDRAGGVVRQATRAFDTRDRFVLGVTPEGTRARSAHWKTGFHRIATTVGVPIVPIVLDYSRRRVVVGPALSLTGNLARDLSHLGNQFSAHQAKRPEHYTPPSADQLSTHDRRQRVRHE